MLIGELDLERAARDPAYLARVRSPFGDKRPAHLANTERVRYAGDPNKGGIERDDHRLRPGGR